MLTRAAHATRDGLQMEVAGEVREVGGDVGLEPGEDDD